MNVVCYLRGGKWLLCAAVLTLSLSFAGCGESSAPAASRRDLAATDSPASADRADAGGAPTAAANGQAAAPARSQSIRNITFDNVKLNMKKGDPFDRKLLTPAVLQLDGNHIRIRGYILPPPQESGLVRFVLVRDNMACCFGPGAAIYDSMIVDMQPGQSIDYTLSPIKVEGTFNIREVIGPNGRHMSIYHVTAEKAE